jgi:hypothetical protein
MALTQIKTAGIAADAVDGTKIADAAVANEHIAADAVNPTQMAHGTDGNLITYDTNGAPGFVLTGNDGQVLTSQGADNVPQFEDVALEGTAVKSTTNSNESSDKFLRADGDGTCSWQAVPAGGITDIVSDTSPQLGGDLDTNSFEIGLDDSHKVKFGDDNDLQLYHDGTDNIIKNNGTVSLKIIDTGGDVQFACHNNGASELYHNGTKKFDTNANGVSVYGNIGFASAGQGIDFGATANSVSGTMGSELFKDYEEGTWLPRVRFSSGGTTGITYAGSSNGGVYTKIGRLVICRGEINLTSKGSDTGYFAITGFPFNEGNYGGNLAVAGSSQGWYFNMANWEKWFTLDMFSNDDVAIWRGGNTGNSNNDRNNSDVNDNSNISFVVNYFTDE